MHANPVYLTEVVDSFRLNGLEEPKPLDTFRVFMNIQSVELVISYITLAIAYVIAVTLSGSCKAWVARCFGDDTAEGLGLLTLNPFAHIDFMGCLFLFIFGFGWGRNVPVNPYKIDGRFRIVKIAAAFFSSSFAHLAMASITLVALVLGFGVNILYVAVPMMCTGDLLQSQFASVYPDASSLAISLGLICIALMFLNVLLAVLDFIISVFSVGTFVIFEHSPSYTRYRDILMIIIPMIMIYFFINPLRLFVVKVLLYVGLILAQWFGGI